MASKLAYYFTVAIIVLFVVSLFGVVLSTPSGAQASPSASASAEPEFKGFGTARATVLDLGNQFLVSCLQASSEGVKAVQGVEGVQTAFRPTPDLIVVLANASAAAQGNGTGGRRIAQAIVEVLLASSPSASGSVGACANSTAPRVLRSALLSFDSPVKLLASPDSGVKGDRTVFPRELSGYGVKITGALGVPGYVDGVSVVKAAVVPVALSVTLASGGITDLLVEQVGGALPSASPPTQANETVAANESSGGVGNSGVSSNASDGAIRKSNSS